MISNNVQVCEVLPRYSNTVTSSLDDGKLLYRNIDTSNFNCLTDSDWNKFHGLFYVVGSFNLNFNAFTITASTSDGFIII